MMDAIAIQQTLNTYSISASIGQWDQVTSTFMPDGIWEVPGLGVRLQGHAAIKATMAAAVAPFAYFVQINSPGMITVNGDQATARSLMRECGKYADRDEALEALGFYDDELVRTAGGWKFTRRTFTLIGKHGLPLLGATSSA